MGFSVDRQGSPRGKIEAMSNPSQMMIYPKDKIESAVAQIVRSISRWFQSTNRKGLTLVSVLEGAKPFTRDLVERLKKMNPEMEILIHEVRVKGTEGTLLLENRKVQEGGMTALNLKNRMVLIVDDLVDSGKTLEMLSSTVVELGAAEVKTAVLIRKFGSASGPVDFCGFDLNLQREALERKGLKDYWLFGYGMDLDGQYRELDHIGWVKIR